MNTTPTQPPTPAELARELARQIDDIWPLVGTVEERLLQLTIILLPVLTALQARAEGAERERDEAIKAHGYVWNAARKAAQYFRWAGCRDTIAIEVMNQCCEAEKLAPKWSTDWVIVTPLELATLRSDLAAARQEVERLKQTHLDCVDEQAAQANIMNDLRAQLTALQSRADGLAEENAELRKVAEYYAACHAQYDGGSYARIKLESMAAQRNPQPPANGEAAKPANTDEGEGR